MSTIVDIVPANEAQARPLTRLTPDLQRKAWRRAVEQAPAGKVTARDVKRAAAEVSPRPRLHPDEQRAMESVFRAYELHGAPDRYVEARDKAWELARLDPELIAEALRVADPGGTFWRDRQFISAMRQWLDRFEAALDSPRVPIT